MRIILIACLSIAVLAVCSGCPGGGGGEKDCRATADCDIRAATRGQLCRQGACAPCDADDDCRGSDYYGPASECRHGSCTGGPFDCPPGRDGCQCTANSACDAGLVCDPHSARCRALITCATLIPACDPASQVCVEAIGSQNAYCEAVSAGCEDPPDCPAGQAWYNEDGGRCVTCPPCSATEPSQTGRLYPVLSKQMGCICETAEGYFYSQSAEGNVPCDEDADGWTRFSATDAIFSTDCAVRANARCALRLVDRIVLHSDDGEALPEVRIAEDEWVADQPLVKAHGGLLPLYETDANDSFAHRGGAGQPPLPPVYTSGLWNGQSRALKPEEVNSLTKACVPHAGSDAPSHDYNDNGIADVLEWQGMASHPSSTPDWQKAYVHYGYFLELSEGWYTDPPAGSGQAGTYHIREKSRAEPLESVHPEPVLYPPEQDEHWRSCYRLRDGLYAGPEPDAAQPNIGMDFGRFSDAGGHRWMGHASQFKCVQVVEAYSDERRKVPHELVVSEAEEDYVVNWCWAEVDSQPVGTAPTADGRNPADPQIACLAFAPPYAQLAEEGKVALVAVKYQDYTADDPQNPTDGYQRGCMNECVHQQHMLSADQCPGFDPDNPDPAWGCNRDPQTGALICTCNPCYQDVDGECQPVPAGADPHADCPGETACDGQGACFDAARGEACQATYECAEGTCCKHEDGISRCVLDIGSDCETDDDCRDGVCCEQDEGQVCTCDARICHGHRIHHVKVQATGDGSGLDWENATTFAQALVQATADEQIWLQAGTYEQPANLEVFQVSKNLTFYGGFLGTETDPGQRGDVLEPENQTVLAGDGERKILLVRNKSDLIIDGLVVSGAGGRGIHVLASSSLRASRMRFENNYGNEGGAISSAGDAVRVSDSVFVSNSAFKSGGAIYVSSGLLLLKNNVFGGPDELGNWARDQGGAISVEGGDTQHEIVNCVFENNRVDHTNENPARPCGGGAVFVESADVRIINSTFFDNASTSSYQACVGGGLLVGSHARARVTSSTFVRNRADPDPPDTCLAPYGGGIFTYRYGGALISNTLLYANSPSEWAVEDRIPSGCPPHPHRPGTMNVGPGCCVRSAATPGTPASCQQIVWDASTLTLQPGSKDAIDKGDYESLPKDVFDLDEDGQMDEILPLDGFGNPRVQGATVDVGANEIQIQ